MDTDKQYANKAVFRSVATWIVFMMIGAYCSRSGMMAFAFSLWAGYFVAVMDTLSFHFKKSIYEDKKNQQWWNPLKSWQNKYSSLDPLIRKKILKYIPIPVAVTDAWHAAKSLSLTCLFAAIGYALYNGVVINWWADALICRACFALGFIPFYSYLFKK